MTVAAFPPYTYYWGDGVTTAFAYPFEVERSEDFVAYVDDVLVSNYTLTGLGNETGGTCTFSAPVASGASLLLLRQVPLDQETMYPAYSPFPAAAHEKTLDRLCMQVWQLQEQLERTTRFRQTIRPPWRNLAYPDPLPNTVLGWDSAGAQWTLYPFGVTQIPVDPVSGIGWGKNTIELVPEAGSAQATGLLFPAGVLALAVSAWVATTLGTSQGLQQVGIGTAEQPDKWGLLPGLEAETTTTAGLFEGYSAQPQLQNGMVTLTAYGGLFDGTGAVYLTGHFLTFGAAHQVGYSYHEGAADDSAPLPAASETVAGVTRYGTPQETLDGLLTTVATHPAGVHAALDAKLPSGTAYSVPRYAASGTALESSPLSIDATPLAVLTNTDLVVRRTSGVSTLAIEGVAGSQRILAWRTGTLARWMLLTTTGAESGSNVGSDLQIVRRDDAGGSLGALLHLQRASGNLGLATTLNTTLGSGASYQLLNVKGAQLYVGQSSTQERALAALTPSFVVATDATRTARLSVTVYDSVAGREGVRLEADGTAARLGFFGSAAVAKPTVTGSRGANAALASALTALSSLGLLTDSSTA